MITCQACQVPCPDDAVFCSKCGAKIQRPEPVKIPKAMTVAEAAKIFFGGAVSPGFLYEQVRKHNLPHVRMSTGKVLLDADELAAWWKEELEKSKVPPSASKLRRIL